MLLFVVLAVLSFQQIDCVPKLFSSFSILIAPGSSFIQYLTWDVGDVPTSCNLSYNDTNANSFVIPIDMNKDVILKSDHFGNRLLSLGRNTCGIKLLNLGRDDIEQFKFDVRYNTPENESKNQSIAFGWSFYDHIRNLTDVTEVVKLGAPYEIKKCGLKSTALNCRLFNPKGKIVSVVTGNNFCSFEIEKVTMDEVGTWKCVSTTNKDMKQYVQNLDLVLDEVQIMETWYRMDNKFGYIGCKYTPPPRPIVYTFHCSFIRPDGRTFNINPTAGGVNNRYTFFGTNLKQFTCKIQFNLPVLPIEIGTWKCAIMITEEQRAVGGFIDVIAPSTAAVDKYMNQKITLKTPFSIFCEVPHSVDNCFVKSPTGHAYMGTEVDNLKGECSVTINRASLADIGTWSCHFPHHDSAVENVIYVEVEKYDSVFGSDIVVNVDEGKTATLMCRSTTPIYYCNFEDPLGTLYHVTKDEGNPNYAGIGLGSGECGVKVPNIQLNQSGVWRCFVFFRSVENVDINVGNSTVRINVIKDMTATAFSIGLPVGVMVIAVVLLSLALFKRYRPKNISTLQRNGAQGDESTDAINVNNSNVRNYSQT